jgi:hypothetical protein
MIQPYAMAVSLSYRGRVGISYRFFPLPFFPLHIAVTSYLSFLGGHRHRGEISNVQEPGLAFWCTLQQKQIRVLA